MLYVFCVLCGSCILLHFVYLCICCANGIIIVIMYKITIIIIIIAPKTGKNRKLDDKLSINEMMSVVHRELLLYTTYDLLINKYTGTLRNTAIMIIPSSLFAASSKLSYRSSFQCTRCSFNKKNIR